MKEVATKNLELEVGIAFTFTITMGRQLDRSKNHERTKIFYVSISILDWITSYMYYLYVAVTATGIQFRWNGMEMGMGIEDER